MSESAAAVGQSEPPFRHCDSIPIHGGFYARWRPTFDALSDTLRSGHGCDFWTRLDPEFANSLSKTTDLDASLPGIWFKSPKTHAWRLTAGPRALPRSAVATGCRGSSGSPYRGLGTPHGSRRVHPALNGSSPPAPTPCLLHHRVMTLRPISGAMPPRGEPAC